MFKGETLRGLLLNAYAFGTMGMIAGIAAIAAFIAAAVMLILGGLGLLHARRVSPAADILGGHPAHARTPVQHQRRLTRPELNRAPQTVVTALREGCHHSPFGIILGPPARDAVIGVCQVRHGQPSRGGLPLLSIYATVAALGVPGSVRTMCSLAASRFRVEGGETRDRSCDQATLRERGTA